LGFVVSTSEQHVNEHEPDAEHRDNREPDREPEREAGSSMLLQEIAFVDLCERGVRIFERVVDRDRAHGFDLRRGDEIAFARSDECGRLACFDELLVLVAEAFGSTSIPLSAQISTLAA
jgi:hypothetical protein